MNNTFGNIYRMTTFGESHGEAIGAIIDGCPSNMELSIEKIQTQLQRRKPGQSKLSTPRNEADQVQCLSGLLNGKTLGTPLTFVVFNHDKKPQDYNSLHQVFRPSHADYTTQIKYGIRAASGGGRSSARETIARVISGSVAEQMLTHFVPSFEICAWVESIYNVKFSANAEYIKNISRTLVDQNTTRCPDSTSHLQMEQVILEAKKRGDSVGGVIRCVIKNVPTGLGSPVFNKLEAELAKAMLSLPACKGFEIGSGFSSTLMYGSQHNDEFIVDSKQKIRTKTNHSGGIQGGISNGEIIDFRVAFKPVATIFKAQSTIDENMQATIVNPEAGRHDPCVLPRAVPIVEAMATHVILDQFLMQKVV